MTTTAPSQNKATLNIDKSKACYLRWSNITKTVEVKDQATGLIKSSIGGETSTPENANAASSTNTNTKVILNQVSGQAKPGEVLALMGPSGSGKTSLLDVLSSRSSYNDGTIYLNSTSLSSRNSNGSSNKMKSLKRKIAYIKQKDIFFDHLTVKDQLMYTAFLRLGDDYSKEQKLEEVNKVIQLLRLEKCADTQIMLVSGGERKRVNIGTELLINPSIIMLDEPTSGLDSTSAVSLMSLLSSLARDCGKTIITSIHQPSSAIFRSFDNVMFLVDGCAVFYGSPTDSLKYCKSLGYACPDGYNAADHWMDLLVEDSAVVPIDNANSSNTTSNSDDDDESSEKEALVSSSFPIKLEDDIENHLGTTANRDDDITRTSESTGNPSASVKKKPKSILSRLSSTFTQSTVNKKGPHLLELTKQIREGYRKRIDTPKARLIIEWDADQHAEQVAMIEIKENGGMVGSSSNGSLYSLSLEDNDNDNANNSKKESKFNTTWTTQFYILLHRSLKNSSAAIWRPINFFKAIALAVLTGLLWFQVPHDETHLFDRQSFIFFCITYWVFDGTFTAIFTFPTERSMIFKERASGSYYLSAYFLSKTLSEMPTRLSLPGIFWTIAYWMSGVNNRFDVFLGTTGCILLAVLAGESYGLLCGALVMDLEKAMTIMIVISLTAMAAGGFYVQNVPTWLTWIKYVSPFKFGFEASQIMIFDDDVKCDGSGSLALYCTEGVEYATREQVLQYFNSEGTIALNVGILLILIFVPRYLSFMALKAKRGAERS
eukprot:CAMPEP_0203663000 /NCGR_PEP_ID=MMETSP0090-20130426/768_1 /ASSEMBLY_ACC=CAM_ASM_001088 /TAXON_ID=426623 /ORGANISM="Chaetoceros affinis, Strain CCMP159" /LENGTH=771 /DNA_ID=CAMNT_0050525859 /DNA_START=135 /DNA_END=2450 /DNA_ORIENTATION=-